MPRLAQVSFSGGELSPSLFGRVDLARYATSLRKCENFFVLPTGGISNRAGLEYVATLNPDSLSTLIPFVFSTEQSYMLVLQEETIQVYSQGAFVDNLSTLSITNITVSAGGVRTITTSAPHGLVIGQQLTISGVVATGDYLVSGSFTVLSIPSSTSITIKNAQLPITGAYTSGGTITYSIAIATDYQSEDLAAIRYTQSADVVTLVHSAYYPSEFIREAATTFSFGEITDFQNGPFLDDNSTATTVTASAATGTGITLTATTAIFTADLIGSQIRIDLEDVSAIAPWEASKLLAANGVNPQNLLRRSLGKVYRCATNETAGTDGTYTGTVRPSHEEGIEEDGDGNPIANLATRAGVEWEYLHSMYGIATITAVAGDGLTATADVDSYIPVVSPATTATWSLSAWSEAQGYPAVVTYFGDRLVFARTPLQPQTQWASKVGEYHNFGESAPLVDDDAITQTLNARQVNAILELVPTDQLVSLTSTSSYASPQRGEVWTPTTIGFDPQSFEGAADLRAVQIGDSAVYAARGARKVRELKYGFEIDKFGGEELSVLARHLFPKDKTIVDWDYAKEPHGILWIVRSDGALIGLTYLPEQQVIGWHRHSTDGYFERVCVIPEEGRDVPYFVVRRTVNGETVRYLERMADREIEDQIDGFFVDSGLTYDGRNTTATTITISGASYDGGQEVTLTASSAIFDSGDIGDAIQFDDVRIVITAFTSLVVVTGQLQTPVPAALQGVASADWTFARDTFSGLDHLEGEEVAICADGAVVANQTVSAGVVTLPNPAGVVHIGLPYVAEAETLNVTIFGTESIRDRQKIIPKAAVVLQDTVGLQIGANSANLEDIAFREDEFYTDPTAAYSDVADAYLIGTYESGGRVLMRQSQPLPATILAVIPHVEIGS